MIVTRIMGRYSERLSLNIFKAFVMWASTVLTVTFSSLAISWFFLLSKRFFKKITLVFSGKSLIDFEIKSSNSDRARVSKFMEFKISKSNSRSFLFNILLL